ncbi:acyl-homoserine-lactone synthase [Litorisediminicola beolgyonensis]|uniref:Acyl-homoserine-lactone synthase n=1 Tax=Litorisediminicola beolgyonensis TaxID=1173614 RepID=A0ABW3ZMN3_9RHOB
MTFPYRKGRADFPVLSPIPAEDLRPSDPKAASASNVLSLPGASRLRATVLSIHTQHQTGEMQVEMMRLRKRIFIDSKGWDLPTERDLEFDQYDTPQSRSIVVHEYGEILAGIRILPTTARCGAYSYMLRDAQLGLIEDIPDYILYEPAPVAPHIWEATRLFVSPEVDAEHRMLVQTRLMTALSVAASAEGATHVIGIVPAIFKRWLSKLGMHALPLGPKLEIAGDRIQAAVFPVGGHGQGGTGPH